MRFQPELMTFADGAPVVSAEDWKRRRAEMLDLLSREEYGITPPAPAAVRGTVNAVDEKCCAGHAVMEDVTVFFDTPKGGYSFPCRFFRPASEGKHPLFVFLNFFPEVYNKYFPLEEIIDGGFAVAAIYYKDVTHDDGDFTDGIAGMYPRRGDGTDWGKIGMWAFCASRAADYFLTRPEVDADRLAVIGHSRLGKTALWAGAQDERFRYVISNDSGCSGAAYEREKHGSSETVAKITGKFPFWFCDNFLRYAKDPDERPFDQHFLLSLIAPRRLAVNSASLDEWADPLGEQLSCVACSPAWELLGVRGFTGGETPAKVGELLSGGNVQYYLRDGTHFLSRADWRVYMDMMSE